MVEASRVGETTTTRRPYQVRLTAEAFAMAGDLEGAREQINRFSRVQPSIPFYRVQPLVAIAWKQLENGDSQAAQTNIEEAKKFVQRIPETGREPWDAVTNLATILAATNQGEEALNLLQQYDRSEDRARSHYWAAAYVVRERGTYDLDQYLANHPWQDWERPQAVAVTLGAAAQDRWDEARQWASSQPGDVDRTDCIIAWADAAAQQQDAAERLSALDSAVEKLPPAGKARAYARAAARLAAGGNTAAAQPLLEKAKSAAGEESPGQPWALGDMRQVHNSEVRDTTSARMAAMAFAEIARAESLLKQQDAAWDSLQRALAVARSTGPSVPAVQSFRQEVEVLGTSGLQSRLQEALNLPSADRARIAANQYQKKLDALLQAARARMDLEAAILAEAARWDLRDRVWQEINSRAGAADLNEQENWFDTAIPAILAAEFKSAGAADQAGAVEAAAAQSTAAAQEQLRRQTAELVASGKAQQAAVALERSELSETDRNRWATRLACRLVREKKLDAALQFVRAFRDPLFQEDALEMIAALAARRGEARKSWDLVQNAGFRSTEKIAYLHGLVAGVERGAPAESPSPPPADR